MPGAYLFRPAFFLINKGDKSHPIIYPTYLLFIGN